MSGALTRTYGYDAAGNATSYGGFTFTYSDAGRMTGVSGSATASYGLNALGQRVKKTISSVSTYFVYDEVGHLIGEYDGSGNLIQETVWMDDAPVATLRPNGGSVSIFYTHTDHLGAPRRISRPSDNAIVWRWDSDPFGADAANEDPDADTNLFKYGLRFPGQYFDAETGLNYNYFRDYDPATGRFLQADPIGQAGSGGNLFTYANVNPLNLIDILGLECEPGRMLPPNVYIDAIDGERKVRIDEFRVPAFGPPVDTSVGPDVQPPRRRGGAPGIGPGVDIEFEIVWLVWIKYQITVGYTSHTFYKQEFICTEEGFCPGDSEHTRLEERTIGQKFEDHRVSWEDWEYAGTESTGYTMPIPLPGFRRGSR